MAKKKNALKQYEQQVQDITNSILNREDFSYNMNADALYEMYKDQYMQQGQFDMRNAMGESAGNTGGYVSSAGITAGNSAYQANLTELNNKVPELYQKALDKYNNEGNDLYNQFGLLNTLQHFEYQKTRDKVLDKQNDRSYKLQKMAYGL